MSVKVYLRKFGNMVATVLLVIFLIAVAGMGSTKFFTIQTIEVEGSGIDVVVDERRLPKNLLFFPSDTVRTELLSGNPLLGDVKIEKKFPHTLIIIPVPRLPIAHLSVRGRVVDVDREGIVLREGIDDHTLPILQFAIEDVHIGQKISDPAILQGLTFIHKQILPVDTITSLDGGSLRIQSGKTNIYITQNADSQAVGDTLQTLLAGFRIKGTLPAIIDLRFSKPVITF